MGSIQDFKQKVEGKVDQAKGKINQERGHGIKGGAQQIKGKIKEEWADAKLRGRQGKKDLDYDHETM